MGFFLSLYHSIFIFQSHSENLGFKQHEYIYSFAFSYDACIVVSKFYTNTPFNIKHARWSYWFLCTVLLLHCIPQLLTPVHGVLCSINSLNSFSLMVMQAIWYSSMFISFFVLNFRACSYFHGFKFNVLKCKTIFKKKFIQRNHTAITSSCKTFPPS